MNQTENLYPLELKICGITRDIDLLICHELGVDYIGFNFYPKSKRYVEPVKAAALWKALQIECPQTSMRAVLVTVDLGIEDLRKIIEIFPDPYSIQLHGRETEAFVLECKSTLGIKVWKAVAVESEIVRRQVDEFSVVADQVLLDSPIAAAGTDVRGGSGIKFQWDRFSDLISRPGVGVAGGINPENIAQLVKLSPSLIDVASGAESSPGIKEKEKIAALLKACRKAIK